MIQKKYDINATKLCMKAKLTYEKHKKCHQMPNMILQNTPAQTGNSLKSLYFSVQQYNAWRFIQK